MSKLKLVSTLGAMALALAAVSPVIAAPSGVSETAGGQTDFASRHFSS